MKQVCRLSLLVLLCATVLKAQEQAKKFDVHGFMDFSLTKDVYPEGSMYYFIGLDDDIEFRLDHINLYFDFKPNSRLRGLTEIRVLTQPHGAGSVPGLITEIASRNGALGDTILVDTTAPRPPVNNSVADPTTGVWVTWGGLSIERAWIEVMFNQHFNLCIGKYITPVGIWNVDHGSPVITSVQPPYMFSFLPLFPASQLGFMVRGIAFLGDIDLDYAVTMSTGRASINTSSEHPLSDVGIDELSEVAVGGNVGATLPVWDGIEIGMSGYTGKLVDQTAWTKVEFVVDWASRDPSAAEQFSDGFSDPDNKEYYTETRIQAREILLALDLKVKALNGLTIQHETLYQQLQNQLANDAKTHTFGHYTLAEYRFRPAKKVAVTPYAMFQRLWAVDATNNPASWFAGREDWGGQVLDAFNVTTLGINVNLFTYFTTKLEWNYIDARGAGNQAEYQGLWDEHKLNAQFVLAF